LNSRTRQFLAELSSAFGSQSQSLEVEKPITTTKAASALAIAYESARNAVEFRAEHLVRQAAIARILKRRLFLNQKSQNLALHLIKELIWARYLKPDSISASKVGQLASIIDKYRIILADLKGNSRLQTQVLEVAACEIEERLVFDPIPQIISNYLFLTLSERLDFEESDPKIKSIQIYIAVERGFGKNGESLITYKLLKTLLPEWFKTNVNPELLKEKFFETLDFINIQLDYPLAEVLRKEVVSQSPPFNLIREMIDSYEEEFLDLVSDQETLEKSLLETLDELYKRTRDKLSRASVRSIIYIFLTKMIIALILELPLDLFLGRVNYLALGVNLGFPPLLMFLLNLDVSLPGEENNQKMVELVEEYFYSSRKPEPKLISINSRKETTDKLFLTLYALMFLVGFGGIIWLLSRLGFNFVSQIIFLFFLSVVSFFAYRVRDIAKDFDLNVGERESFISSLKDFIFLPFIKVGQWLSVQIASINVLSFVLDFVIEAPLKAILDVVEDWIHFVKTKKEEIVS